MHATFRKRRLRARYLHYNCAVENDYGNVVCSNDKIQCQFSDINIVLPYRQSLLSTKLYKRLRINLTKSQSLSLFSSFLYIRKMFQFVVKFFCRKDRNSDSNIFNSENPVWREICMPSLPENFTVLFESIFFNNFFYTKVKFTS